MINESQTSATMASELEQGWACYAQRKWADAYDSLSRADQATPLVGKDLELLAMAAYLIGRDEDYLSALERAHQAYLDAGESVRAVRCAFWLGLRLLFRGETGRATGWLARARRLLERETHECAERGYLLLPVVEQQLGADDCESAYATAASAAEIGERCGDTDLIACARHQQGRIRLQQGQVEKGLALLDEVMVAVTAGELSSLVTGLMYCSVIQACQEVYAFGRAGEWTAALARWCEEQPEMVAFTGVCRVHRAEIMQLRGAWQDAIEEAQRACERSQGIDQHATAAAFYQQAEVHRLRGEFAAAEEAYRSASQWGRDPQPGLALLRLVQGQTDAAAAAIRRAVSATTHRLQRSRLLPAYVEIMLAIGDIQEARGASSELEELAETFEIDVLRAMAAQARGAIDLAEGDTRAALGPLRRALEVWRQVEAPYGSARVRVLMGMACRSLGDDEAAELELGAASAVFEQLGAGPDLSHTHALVKGATPDYHHHGLTPRERQVLRLVATGKTNKAIATELFLSARTIDRHVSNIFTKLDVPSRAAATAYAYAHKLI
ncbi:MAG: LuxR C-terminal-related transcriptional regulator [Gammaproteobacteria bacterium]